MSDFNSTLRAYTHPVTHTSSFFARPIVVALIYSQTTRQVSPNTPFEPVKQPTPSVVESASPNTPIIQTRQVHLQCAGKVVCTATSTVRITSPEIAHLFLQEKYAIGQLFRRLEKVPAFELVAVGFGAVEHKEKFVASTSSTGAASGSPPDQLWRKYTLGIPHFECEILEVFPDRQMFVKGEKWLDNEPVPEVLVQKSDVNHAAFQGLKAVAGGACLLIASFEAFKLLNGKAFC